MLRSIPLCGIGVLLTMAAVGDRASAQNKTRLEWPAQARLSIAPSALPSPALKYRLLAPAADQTVGNAAPIYLAAFPAGAQIDVDKLEEYLNTPVDQLPVDEVRAYVSRFEDSLHMLQVAGNRSYCQWDDPIREEGWRLSLGYVRNGRLLGCLLGLQIRLQMRDGHFDDALRSVQTGFALARAYSTSGLYLHTMAATDSDGIEKVLYDCLREWTQTKGSPNLYWALVNLPRPFHDRRRVLEIEDAAVYFTFPDLRRTQQLSEAEAEQILEQIWGVQQGLKDSATAREAVAGYIQRMLPHARESLTSDREPEDLKSLPPAVLVLTSLVTEYRREVDELYKWAGMPYWQASTGLGKSLDRFNASDRDNLLLKLVPRLNSQFLVIETREREGALLQCVESIRAYSASHGGKLPPSLMALSPDTPAPIDPVLGRPFDYSVQGDTAVLKAASPMPGFAGSKREYHISLKH